MLLNQEVQSKPDLADKKLVWANRLDPIGRGTLRYGLVALLLLALRAEVIAAGLRLRMSVEAA